MNKSYINYNFINISADGVLGIMQYIRQSLCEIMFELFVRSGNIAF